MRGQNWWNSYGPFDPWKRYLTRPDPDDAFLFYLNRRGVMPRRLVPYLMDRLNLQEAVVEAILKGKAWDSISCCRQLVSALEIYPPLLGIDAKYAPIERHAYWWQAYGFSFHADAEGYPVMSEVVAGLRMQRTITEGGSVRAWSQSDLGIATGLSNDAIQGIENGNNQQMLDSMSCRFILASALGNLAGENEPTLFRLFNLDPQAYGISVPLMSEV